MKMLLNLNSFSFNHIDLQKRKFRENLLFYIISHVLMLVRMLASS